MKLVEELKRKRMDAISNHALKIAEDYEAELIEAAEQGYLSFSIALADREDVQMLLSEQFQKDLELMLEGCSVEIRTKTYENLFKNKYHRKYLIISWK